MLNRTGLILDVLGGSTRRYGVPANLINSIGLVFDIVGVLLLWRYGLPAEVDPQGRQFIMTSDRDAGEIAKGKRYVRRSRLGIGCFLLGFILQLLSNLVA